MRRRELARYHDLAASTKVRGAGIGFAGVGIKIALLVCAEVVTETRRAKHHVASAWHLASRQKAPWRWVPPPGLVAAHGTAVRLTPTNVLSPLLDPGFIEGAIQRNFQPLLDPALAEIFSAHYPRGVAFVLNGRRLEQHGWRATESASVAIRMARRRKPVGVGYLARDAAPLPEDFRGIAVSTFGKVIKRGWDWLGVAPSVPERLGGLIEVPALAECLTLNKADFIRAGARGATYLAYRKAIQEAVSRQLALWGGADEADERTRRLPVASAAAVRGHDAGPLFEVHEPTTVTGKPTAVADAEPIGRPSGPSVTGAPVPEPTTGHLAAGPRTRRPARYGLAIQFEERPDDPELARLVESTVLVNEAHPAYRRAVASRSEGYHVALSVALALAPLAVDPAKEHAFITAFLASWGAALGRRRAGRRR